VVAFASLPLAPLNALARMQTACGRSDLENELAAWWAEPAIQNLAPWLLDFADADTVYLTYGQVLPAGRVGMCRRGPQRRPARVSSVEGWGWRLTIGSPGLMCLGQLGAYWLALVDEGYVVILLRMLAGAFGNITLSAGLVRSGFRPRTAAWVILLDPASQHRARGDVHSSTRPLADDVRLGTDRLDAVAVRARTSHRHEAARGWDRPGIRRGRRGGPVARAGSGDPQDASHR
jgi:hypothetical protein